METVKGGDRAEEMHLLIDWREKRDRGRGERTRVRRGAPRDSDGAAPHTAFPRQVRRLPGPEIPEKLESSFFKKENLKKNPEGFLDKFHQAYEEPISPIWEVSDINEVNRIQRTSERRREDKHGPLPFYP